MNLYFSKVRKAVVDYQDEVSELAERRRDIEKNYQDGNLSKNDYEKKIKDLASLDADKGDFNSKLNEVQKMYEQHLDEWSILHGDNITDDVKLLQNPIELTALDYERLEEKYKGNYTMLRAIQVHAKDAGVVYKKRFSVDKAEKIESMEQVITAAKNIVGSLSSRNEVNYTGLLWRDEEKFNDVYSKSTDLIKLGQ